MAAIRLLIIHPQMNMVVKLKQALEQTREYVVNGFIKAEPALDLLRNNPQDVVLIHADPNSQQAGKMIQQLRAAQPDLAIVVTPRQNDIGSLRIQGMIDSPFTARELITVLRKALDPTVTQPAPPEPPASRTPRPTRRTDEVAAATAPPTERPTQPAAPERRPVPPPTIASLGQIVKDFGIEPPIEESDTLQVPTKDSGALRQFLATSGDPRQDDDFRDILGTIENDHPTVESDAPTSFDNLITSMAPQDEVEPLPQRRSRLVDMVVNVQRPAPPATLPPEPAVDDSDTFGRLAAEEPPVPDLQDGGTVSDFMVRIDDSNFRSVLDLLREKPTDDVIDTTRKTGRINPVAPEDPFSSFYGKQEFTDEATDQVIKSSFDELLAQEPPVDKEASVAQVVLESTLDNTRGEGSVSVEQLLTDIEARLQEHQLRIRPLPSWDMDTTNFNVAAVSVPTDPENREPGFLPGELPPGELIPPELPTADASDVWTTRASKATLDTFDTRANQIEETLIDAIDLDDTRSSKPVELAPPPMPDQLPEFASEPTVRHDYAPTDDAWSLAATAEPEAPQIIDDWGIDPQTEAPPLSPEEMRLARMALTLTQMSLETSAEGTLLTQKNQIIAVSGHLSTQDTVELTTLIHNDWSTEGRGARLRYFTLPSSGKDYLLYSIRTEGGLVLSTIFDGKTPLSVIREQSRKLATALQAVPEDAAEMPEAPSRPAQALVTQPVGERFTYLWLLNDPQKPLSPTVATAITAGLTTQLRELAWDVQQVQVEEDYVYLLAGVPGETPSYAVVRDLKKRASEIASTVDRSLAKTHLWADSYLVLTPGREMSLPEIQEFINFQRMM